MFVDLWKKIKLGGEDYEINIYIDGEGEGTVAIYGTKIHADGKPIIDTEMLLKCIDFKDGDC